MTTTIQSTRLDFFNIKNRLKTFLAQQPEFADYNFEASGLSNILDVLAWNTHFNGLIANFATNEAFLTTAQLRSSVVSLAESLGYTPRSKTSAVAYVRLSVNLSTASPVPSSVTLPAGTTFTTTVANNNYVFRTLETYTATNNGAGVFQFATSSGSTSLPIYEGASLTKTFFVGSSAERRVYIIPDENIDTSTMRVDVYDSPTSSSYTTYTPLFTAVGLTSTSTHYIVTEAPNGYYDLSFGDGQSTGLAPVAGNKIVVTYLSTAGADANGASTFTAATPYVHNGNNYSLTIQVVTTAAGGAEKESIESIRLNAPLAFATQQRLVTAEDYRAAILTNYPIVVDAVAWGGEDNIPVQYGKVFVGMRFADGTSDITKAATKASIIDNITSKLAMLSIDTEFVDPVTTLIELGISFNYNPDLTGLTANALERSVITAVDNYFTNNLSKFNAIFRKSVLLTTVKDVNSSILNASSSVKLQQRITPAQNGLEETFDVYFPAQLLVPNGFNYVITSSLFLYNGKTCRLVNKILPHSATLQVVDTNNAVVVDNVGQYFPSTGRVLISGLIVNEIVGGATFIKIKATPADVETIRPLRNYVLDLDVEESFASAIVDRQTTLASLT